MFYFYAMANNYYNKFSTQELIEVYTTTIDNYGKIEGELLAEVNSRGGEALLKQQITDAKVIAKERQRIAKEVQQYTNDAMDVALIKKFIQSDIFSPAELENEIDKVYGLIRKAQHNRKIDGNVIAGCAVGIVVGSGLGSLLIYLELLFFPILLYPSFLIVYGIAYYIIRLITKRNAANLLVLLSALLATILAFAIVLSFIGNFFS
jgi:hypothetical protein